MASTNKTTNYELSQFVETDRPAWLTDYNGDMRTIDSTMKAISDVASGASGSISELADRMSTAEGNISTNANDIDALEARADSLEAQAQSTSGTIANIQTEQTAQNLGIEAATELGYNLARPYDSASTYAVGDYVLFQNTLYKCITAVPVGEAFDATKWLAIKATDEISAGGYTLPIASASQLGGVKVGINLSIDANGVLSASGGASVTIEDVTGTAFTNANASNQIIIYMDEIINGHLQRYTGYLQDVSITQTTRKYTIGDINLYHSILGLRGDGDYPVTGSDIVSGQAVIDLHINDQIINTNNIAFINQSPDMKITTVSNMYRIEAHLLETVAYNLTEINLHLWYVSETTSN